MLNEEEKKIAAKEFKNNLKEAEDRVYKAIKRRMNELANDIKLKKQQEQEIQECLTDTTEKDI